MKRYLVFALIVLGMQAAAQSNYEQYKILHEKKDTAAVKKLLTKWEKEEPNNPELYTSGFNHYFARSMQETISLDKEQGDKGGYTLKDSAGNVAGFLNTSMSYHPKHIETAFTYANRGIEKFPDRLDIRFGKCFVLGKLEDYDKFTAEIIKTVEYSAKNKNSWLWTENEKVENPETFLLDGVQDYLLQLYDTENDDLLKNMQDIGEATLRLYPNNIKILSTTAISYMLTQEYDKAIRHLKQAEKIDPTDFIVLNNIAEGYKRMGDKENAIKYFELTAKYGDERAKKSAAEALRQLKN